MRTPRSWLAFVDLALLNQRGHLFPWTPVASTAGPGVTRSLSCAGRRTRPVTRLAWPLAARDVMPCNSL